MNGGVRILHVDDDPAFVDVSATLLETEDDRFDVDTETSPEAALRRVRANTYDCVVSDYDMPGMNGIELLEAIRETHTDLPFVLFTGQGSESIAGDAVAEGATDYLRKAGGTEKYTVLANRVGNAVESYRATRRFETFAATVDDAFYLITADYTDVQYINDAAEKLYGVSAADIRADPTAWFRHIVPEDEARLRASVEAQQMGTADWPLVQEFRVDHPDCGRRWLRAQVYPVGSPDDPDRVAGVTTDVTDRVERESELDLRAAAMESTMDGIAILDENGVYRYTNEAHADVFGYDPEDLLGDTWRRLYDDDEVDRIEGEAFPELDRTGEWRGETVGRRCDDGPVHQEVTLTRLETGGLICTNRDITDRVEKRRELERTNAVLSTLLNGLPAGVVAENGSREVLVTNEKLFDLFGLPGDPNEAVGRDCARMAADLADRFVEDDFDDRVQQVVDERDPVDGEELHLEDGRVLERSYRPVDLPDGDGHVWLYRDVTAVKTRERSLERERDRLDRFATVVGHDLRSPIEAATGHLELLARELRDEGPEAGVGTDGGEPSVDHIDGIRDQLGRMDTLVEDVLTLARGESSVGTTAPVPSAAAADTAWSANAPGDATLVVDDSLPVVDAARSRLTRLFENLFRNAREHASQDVVVRVGELDGEEDGFYVEDDGPGVPADERDRIFEAGYSTSNTGVGLGLSIVKEIADAHGWTIEVIDAEGGGARFEVAGVETHGRTKGR